MIKMWGSFVSPFMVISQQVFLIQGGTLLYLRLGYRGFITIFKITIAIALPTIGPAN